MGSSSSWGVTEYDDAEEACVTPDGIEGAKNTLVDDFSVGSFVTRFDSTGDLLFTRYRPGEESAFCFVEATGTGYFAGTQDVVGGTGRFAGATGSIVYTGTFTIFAFDAAGNFFGEQNGGYNGIINLD